MPITTKQVRRYRGYEIVELRRLIKVIDEIGRHQIKYPQGPPPDPLNRRHLAFEAGAISSMGDLRAACVALLAAKWPPDEDV